MGNQFQHKMPYSSAACYRAGTLVYSPVTLFLVCTWMLWGGLCYNTLAYVLIPTVLPLTLNSMGASNQLIGLIVGSIPAAMNLVMNPIISTASDRLRTRWGRRIPFLFIATPFVALFLTLVGWSPQLVTWAAGFGGNVDPGPLGIIMVCIFSIMFQFFSLIVGSVYCYIYADVIPHQILGRFMALMQIFSMLGGFFFNYFLMKYVENNAQWVYSGIAVVYLISFLGMCFTVKEGSYPPPEPYNTEHNSWFQRINKVLRIYCRECFGSSFYLMLFIGTALTQVSTICRTLFNALFATRELNLTTAQFGTTMAHGAIASIGILVFAGYLLDKLKPLRVFIVSGIVVIAGNVFGYFQVTDYDTFYWIGIFIVVIYAVQSLCVIPMFTELFPEGKFGQFSSANAIVNCLGLVLANWGGGKCIDLFGYRFIFIWDMVFTVLATMALMYVYWKCRNCKFQGVPA